MGSRKWRYAPKGNKVTRVKSYNGVMEALSVEENRADLLDSMEKCQYEYEVCVGSDNRDIMEEKRVMPRDKKKIKLTKSDSEEAGMANRRLFQDKRRRMTTSALLERFVRESLRCQ